MSEEVTVNEPICFLCDRRQSEVDRFVLRTDGRPGAICNICLALAVSEALAPARMPRRMRTVQPDDAPAELTTAPVLRPQPRPATRPPLPSPPPLVTPVGPPSGQFEGSLEITAEHNSSDIPKILVDDDPWSKNGGWGT